MTQETTSARPSLITKWSAFNHFVSTDLLGGPRWLKLAWVINMQKAGTLFFVLGLMLWYDNFTTAAWVYLALHGSYGLCWILKDIAFPDPGWQRRVTFGGAVMSFVLVLGPYWVFPYLLISGVLGPDHPQPSGARLAACIGLHTLGVVIMIAADCQKHFTLRLRPGLITTGMFRHVRHPNYTGEMMLYGSYALLVGHWIPWAILAWVWCGIFMVNILAKEISMSRSPEWAAYRRRTGMLLPWRFPLR
jgi:protein-S-isoprenylcysteine O-methyltransferase Ste14